MTEVEVRLTEAPPGFAQGIESVPFLMAFTIIESLPHTFEPARTPLALRRYERDADWKLPALASRYPRCSTDRETAEEHNLEWGRLTRNYHLVTRLVLLLRHSPKLTDRVIRTLAAHPDVFQHLLSANMGLASPWSLSPRQWLRIAASLLSPSRA